MMLVRDDLAHDRPRRGVVPLRERQGRATTSHEKVCIDYKDRRGLPALAVAQLARGDVGRGGELPDARAGAGAVRQYSGDEYQEAEYKVDKDAKEIGGADNRERAKFWEIWDKRQSEVVWVAEGCEDILDEDDPTLELQNFFPCPKPAYGTVQRGSLVPVPDVLQYKDQLDEVNMLTGRIHALSDALEVKGFYPAGGAETRRRGAGRGARSRRRAACWCRSATGRRSAASRRSSSGCRST